MIQMYDHILSDFTTDILRPCLTFLRQKKYLYS